MSMIVTKKSLPRRTFLRGVGVAMALPLLDGMVPALTAMNLTAAKPVRRLGFVYVPNGIILDRWTPVSGGTNFEFPATMKALQPFRERVVVLSGLSSVPEFSENNHAQASTAWLSAVPAKRTEGVDIQNGKTADQIAADELGAQTQLRSLELATDDIGMAGNCENGYACTYLNTLSWRTPTMPLPMQTNPRLVFERLFGSGGTAAQRHVQRQKYRSILDAVTESASRLQQGLGPQDRNRLGQYLDGVREVEQRIEKIEAQPALEVALPGMPSGVPDLYEDHVKLMYDLQVLAYQTDMTRVATFMTSREGTQRTYRQIGVIDPHHALSHHGNDPAKLDNLGKIDAYNVSLFAYYLEKLRTTSDGDGSLLDHSLIMYGSGMGDGNLHSRSPLPTLLAGGAAGQLKGGRHIQCPVDTPLANLLLNILLKVGIQQQSIGDSTGILSGV